MKADSFLTEEDFEKYLAAYFERCGCVVHRQSHCNVYDDASANNSGLRRADLHVQLPKPVDGGWLRSFAVELKLDDNGTRDIRAGAKQAIAYMRAFDWREGPSRHDERRLPRPDVSLFTTPRILASGGQLHTDWLYLERDLWDNGAALLVSYRGAEPGTMFRLIERRHYLTGREAR